MKFLECNYINCYIFCTFQFRIHRWLTIIWGVSFIKFTEQSITGVTYRDHFDFEERYRDEHKCDPNYWHPLHMPEHCIKQYEKMIRSRTTRSKPLKVIKEKNRYKSHAIDPETLPSSNELNSINNIISYDDLGSPNNYYDLISSSNYNVPVSPNNYNYLISSNQYRVPPILNQYNDWTSISKHGVGTSTSQYYDPKSANNLNAPVPHIDIDDFVPLRNGRRVDHSDDREYDDDNGNSIDYGQNDHRGDHRYNYEYYTDPKVKMISGGGNYNNLGDFGHYDDHSHYIDFGRHGIRDEYNDHVESHNQNNQVSPGRKAFRQKHKKRVHQSESMSNQDSLELVYNRLHNIMKVEQFNMEESSEDTMSRNHNSRHSHSRNRKRQRGHHNKRALLRDHKRHRHENSDYGLLYDYGHDIKPRRSYSRPHKTDEDDSYEYQYTLEHNYNDKYNDVSHEYDIDKYVNDDARIDSQSIDQYLGINTDSALTSSVPRRLPRQNVIQDAMFIGDNVSPFNIESVFYTDSISSDEEPVHIPILGYQSPVQSMFQAIETDVRNQPIAPQIGVLPFLGVSAIYHQPISKNSVDLIKDVAHSYQEAAKEQYNEMAKYFPPQPPQPYFPLPDFSENITTTNPIEYYPRQRKDDKLMNKIRHKILENAKHLQKDGERNHKVTNGVSSQDNIFLRQYK